LLWKQPVFRILDNVVPYTNLDAGTVTEVTLELIL